MKCFVLILIATLMVSGCGQPIQAPGVIEDLGSLTDKSVETLKDFQTGYNLYGKVTRVERENHLGYALFMRLYADSGQVMGSLRAPWISWRRTVQLYDETHRLSHEARMNLLSWGRRVEVFDASKTRLQFVIRERVWHSAFKVFTAYEIKDAKQNLIALSEKTEFIQRQLIIKDALTHQPQFKLSKNPFDGFAEFFGFDKWRVENLGPGRLPNHVALIIAGMQTMSDIRPKPSSSRHSE